jgi:hypothetical protein
VEVTGGTNATYHNFFHLYSLRELMFFVLDYKVTKFPPIYHPAAIEN